MKHKHAHSVIVFLLLALLAAALLAAFPASAQIAPAQSLEARIATLLAEVRALQQQLIRLQQNAPQEAGGTLSSGQQEQTLFSQTLRQGMSGPEVSQLQQILAQTPAIYPEGLATGFYGPLTEAAVRRYQQREGLLQTGVLDTATRNRLNSKITGLEVRIPQEDAAGDFFLAPAAGSQFMMGSSVAIRWIPPDGIDAVPFSLIKAGRVLGELEFASGTGTPTRFVQNSGAVLWLLPLAQDSDWYPEDGGSGYALLGDTHAGQVFRSAAFSILPFNPVLAASQTPTVLNPPAPPSAFQADRNTVARFGAVRYTWSPPTADVPDHYELRAAAHAINDWIGLGKTREATIIARAPEGAYRTELRSCGVLLAPCPESAASAVVWAPVTVLTPAPYNLALSVTPQRAGKGEAVTISWTAESADDFELHYDWSPRNGTVDTINAVRRGLKAVSYDQLPASWFPGVHQVRLRACNSRGVCGFSAWAQFSVTSAPATGATPAPTVNALQSPDNIASGIAAQVRWESRVAKTVIYERDWFRDNVVEETFALEPASGGTLRFADTADPATWPVGEHRFRLRACGDAGCTLSRWYNYAVTE